MKKIISLLMVLIICLHVSYVPLSALALSNSSKNSISSSSVSVSSVTDITAYENIVGYLNPYMNDASFQHSTTFSTVLYANYFIADGVNYNRINSDLRNYHYFVDYHFYDLNPVVMPYSYINNVKKDLYNTTFTIVSSSVTTIDGSLGVLATIAVNFNVSNDFFNVDFFRYKSLGSKNYLSLLPATLYLFNSYGTSPWEIQSFSFSNTTFNFNFSFDASYSVKSIISSLWWGFGDSDIFSRTYLKRDYRINTYFNNSKIYSTSNNNFNYLFTFDSPYKVNNISFALTLPGNTSDKLQVSLDYGLRFYVYNNYFNMYSLNNDISNSVSDNLVDYVTCQWYDLPCHLGNSILYLLYEFPLTKPIVDFFNTLFQFIRPLFDFLTKFANIPYLSVIFFMFLFLGLLFFIVK